MQPGVSDRYKDSVGSSNYYYTNPYREDFDYRRAEQARTVKNRAVDSLETTQQRVERELLEKLMAKKGQMALGSIALLQQLGKFAFLALMLPPYIMFFGMPKLAFKKVHSIATSLVPHAAFYWNKAASYTSLQLTKIFTWPLHKTNLLLKKFKETFTHATQNLKDKVLVPFNKWIYVQRQGAAKLLEKAILPVKKVSQAIQSWISKLSKAFDLVKMPSIKLSINLRMPTISFQKVIEKIKTWRSKVQDLTNTSKKKVLDAAIYPAKLIEAAWLFLWQPLSQIRLPHYRLPQFAKVKDFYKNTVMAASRFVKPFIEASIKAKQAIQENFQKLAKIFTNLGNRLKDKTSKGLQFIGMKLQKITSKVSTFMKRVHNLVKRGKDLPGKTKEKWQYILQQAKMKCKNAFEASMQFFMAKSSIFLQLMKKMLNAIGLFFKNFLFALRILYAVICLLIKFTAQGIKEKFAQELLSNQSKD